MSNDLVVSTGGAVTVPATAVGEHVGDFSRDTGHAPSFDWSPREPETIVNLMRQMLRDIVIDGIGEHEIERCLPVLEDYAPATRAAFKTSNRQELARIGHSIRDELLRKGLISLEHIERIRPILQRYSQESERALIGPGAGNTAMIDEIRELDSLMADRKSRYWRGEDAERLQRRWRELHDLGVRADSNRSTADSDVKDRIEEIDGWMGARPGSADFNRYWKDPLVQEEYRKLLQRRK
jgi:hypothetical protein